MCSKYIYTRPKRQSLKHLNRHRRKRANPMSLKRTPRYKKRENEPAVGDDVPRTIDFSTVANVPKIEPPELDLRAR
jgi:hypothetical protein